MDNRAPSWAAALLACLFPFLVVSSFDELEGTLGDATGIDGGPSLLALVALLFLFTWATMIPVLARAKNPSRAGLLAGSYVAGVILLMLAASVEFFFIVLLLFALFGGLAIGAGTLAGSIASALAGGKPSKRLAATLVAMGLLIVLAAGPFLPGPGIALFAPLLLLTLLLSVGLFVGGGIWLWRRAQSG